MWEGWHYTHIGRHLQDHIISLIRGGRGEGGDGAGAHKTRLTPTLFIAVDVSNQVCSLVIFSMNIFGMFLLEVGCMLFGLNTRHVL